MKSMQHETSPAGSQPESALGMADRQAQAAHTEKNANARILAWANTIAVLVGLIPIIWWLAGGSQAAAPTLLTPGSPMLPLSAFEQWLAVSVAFGVKPFYMLVSLGLIIWFWRFYSIEVAALRWGLIWFWLGENACSINYLLFQRDSDFWEYLHNYGMAAGFAFITCGIAAILDRYLIRISEERERCALLGACHTCYKSGRAQCSLRTVMMCALPGLALISLLPLSAPFKHISYGASILGSMQHYSHPLSCQYFENRFCAALALTLFLAAWITLLCRSGAASMKWARLLAAVAAGPLSFGMLRLFFVSTFQANLLWFDVWEESTELLFMSGLAVVAWTFRKTGPAGIRVSG